MADGPYSVVQFFEDGSYEYVRRTVDVHEAAKAYGHYTTSVGAGIGTTTRVIITDWDDTIVCEWQFGLGQVWPPKEPVQ